MATKIHKQSIESLQALKAEATDHGHIAEAEWRSKMANQLAGIISKNPVCYRAYGPYWWILKKELIDNGITMFGETVNADGFDMADYGDATYNLLAAWAYGEYAMDMGLIYSNEHNIDIFTDNGTAPEPKVYVLVDDEVERLMWR